MVMNGRRQAWYKRGTCVVLAWYLCGICVVLVWYSSGICILRGVTNLSFLLSKCYPGFHSTSLFMSTITLPTFTTLNDSLLKPSMLTLLLKVKG